MSQVPIYEITTDSQLHAVSLVEEPAIDEGFLAFEKSEQQFSVFSYQQIVSGPALIPDRKILRYDKDRNPYYVYFTRESIHMIVKNFMMHRPKFNVGHSDNLLDNSTILESWFCGERDKSQSWGYNLPPGTWFISLYVADTQFFNDKILSGEISGFSVEGRFEQFLGYEGQPARTDDKLKQIAELLKNV